MLRRQIQAKVAAATDSSVASRQPPDAGTLDEIKRLQTLLEQLKQFDEIAIRLRRAIFVAPILAATIAVILFFLPVRAIDIDLDVQTSGIVFTLAETAHVFKATTVKSLTVIPRSGTVEADLPQEQGHGNVAGTFSSLSFATMSSDSAITLEPLLFKKGTRIEIEAIGPARVFRITAHGAAETIGVASRGDIGLESTSLKNGASEVKQWIARGGPSITLNSQQTLVIEYRTIADEDFADVVPVSEVAFQSTRDEPEGELIRPVTRSGVLGGTIVDITSDNLKHSLGPRNRVELRLSSHGTPALLGLALSAGALRANVRASVTDALVGSDRDAQSLKPSTLVWIFKSHNFDALKAVTVGIYGFLLAAYKWLYD
ncbi:MAG TPA: hypothetical protein VGQ34_13035 [Sphingomicrobium sp.]|nr:hypothetical protein [Sphingomicrobium sp.]